MTASSPTFASVLWAGGPPYREAKGGSFDSFHHKRPVRTVTDI